MRRAQRSIEARIVRIQIDELLQVFDVFSVTSALSPNYHSGRKCGQTERQGRRSSLTVHARINCKHHDHSSRGLADSRLRAHRSLGIGGTVRDQTFSETQHVEKWRHRDSSRAHGRLGRCSDGRGVCSDFGERRCLHRLGRRECRQHWAPFIRLRLWPQHQPGDRKSSQCRRKLWNCEFRCRYRLYGGRQPS